MDAPLVRAYLDGLPDAPPDGRSVDRVRFCLHSLQRPDIRYLVAVIVGGGAAEIARVTSAILRAAGAPTATLGPTSADATLDGAPIDDGLLARAGTLTASADYQLRATGSEGAELTRREAQVILALTAFAEANERVALLVDEEVRPDDPIHAPTPDLVTIGEVDGTSAERALSLVPEGRPAVTAELAGEIRDRCERLAGERGIPILVGGRDHSIVQTAAGLEFSVRGERYVTVEPVAGFASWRIAAGIATALALGVMGIRMREDWISEGLATLRLPVAS